MNKQQIEQEAKIILIKSEPVLAGLAAAAVQYGLQLAGDYHPSGAAAAFWPFVVAAGWQALRWLQARARKPPASPPTP